MLCGSRDEKSLIKEKLTHSSNYYWEYDNLRGNSMALLGPIHTNAFSEMSVFISVKTTLASSTLAFSYRFHLSTQKRSKAMKTTGTWDCKCVNVERPRSIYFRPSAILNRCSNLDWNQWHVMLFTKQFSQVSVFACPDWK